MLDVTSIYTMCAPITFDDISSLPPRIQDEVRGMLIFTFRMQMVLYATFIFMFLLMLFYTWLT